MKKSIILWIKSILFSTLFTFTVYNTFFDSWSVQFIYDAFGFFIFSIHCFRVHKQKDISIGLIILLPVFSIDLSVLINGSSLIPLRFPYATLFHIIGIFIGYCLVKKRKLFVILVFPTLLFFFISTKYITPQLINYLTDRNNKINLVDQNLLFDKDYLNENGDTIKISFFKNEFVIFNLFFVKCTPCSQKLLLFNELREFLPKSKFIIYEICNSKLSTYDEFKQFVKQKKNILRLTFLYDFNGVIEQQKSIHSYPVELIYLNKKLIKSFNGYNSETKSLIINEHKKIFENIEKY